MEKREENHGLEKEIHTVESSSFPRTAEGDDLWSETGGLVALRLGHKFTAKLFFGNK